MLFHVTATHTTENCPGYHREKMPAIVTALENLEATAKELAVKVHFLVNGAPEHVSFTLLEADSPASVAQFLATIPFEQDFKVTPVQHEEELLAMIKQMMAQG
ncbi:MAG: DUF3303 family protein [Dehalococcoidia bacterium]